MWESDFETEAEEQEVALSDLSEVALPGLLEVALPEVAPPAPPWVEMPARIEPAWVAPAGSCLFEPPVNDSGLTLMFKQ
jgi:hypothetical protein